MKEYRVNVYENGEVVARVRYNSNLDYWNGKDWQNGGFGHHKGLTRLTDGRYVLIHGTQWQGEKDWAEIISPYQAYQEIVKSGNLELLRMKKFAELAKFFEEMENLDVEEEL